MDVEPGEIDPLVPGVRVEQRDDAVGVDAELVLFLAGGGVLVRVRIDVGVDAHAQPGHHAELARQARDRLELALRLDVEHAHRPAPRGIGRAEPRGVVAHRAEASVERGADLGVALADAGEDDVGHRRAGEPGALHLAARDHVHAGAERAQQAAEVEVGAGLDGVVEARSERRERRGEALVGGADRGRRVDVGRCARRLGDRRHRDLVHGEDAGAPADGVFGRGHREASIGGATHVGAQLASPVRRSPLPSPPGVRYSNRQRRRSTAVGAELEDHRLAVRHPEGVSPPASRVTPSRGSSSGG